MIGNPQPLFARHETFYPRPGWFWKAVNLADQSPDIFVRPDATVELGVGKNMVRAIRYWALASRLISEYPDPDRPRRSLARPTALGRLLFGSDGVDPYLEDHGTLWFLHWILVRRGSMASAWEILLGQYPSTEFRDEDAQTFIADRSRQRDDWPAVSSASIRRDVQCILQMYAPVRRSAKSDDGIDSPFRLLSLLGPSAGDNTHMRFTYGLKPGLTPSLVAFACLDFVAAIGESRTVTISRLAGDPGSPGMVFRLREADLVVALGEAASVYPDLVVVSPAGVSQLVVSEEPASVALRILGGQLGRAPQGRSLDSLFEPSTDVELVPVEAA